MHKLLIQEKSPNSLYKLTLAMRVDVTGGSLTEYPCIDVLESIGKLNTISNYVNFCEAKLEAHRRNVSYMMTGRSGRFPSGIL